MAEEPATVSRETFGPVDGHASAAEVEPLAAQHVFGEHLELARRFTADLAQYGETLGLIGPLEASRLWSRHVINCAIVAPFVRVGAQVADIGSGAGLPGLVLAIARPDAHFVLVEPMERRTDWLLAETARLGLTNVTVLRTRAEEVLGASSKERDRFDQVTARAVSALTKLIPLVAPLVREHGELLLLKGARVHDEVEAASAAIRRYRLVNIEVLELGDDIVPEVTRLFRATVGGAS